MPNTDQDTFITWLKDAHAMEEKLIPELKAHMAQAEGQPVIQSKIQQHLQETERHAAAVEGLIKQLGSSVSAIKTTVGKATAAAAGMVTGMAEDKLVKNALAEFTMEHTEIGSYISLIAAAEHLHLPDAVQTLRRILLEEEAMADWLRHQIASITLQHLEHESMAAANA